MTELSPDEKRLFLLGFKSLAGQNTSGYIRDKYCCHLQADRASLDNRFCNFREDGTGGIPKELQLFDIFSREISSIISGRKEMPPEDIVSLQVDL